MQSPGAMSLVCCEFMGIGDPDHDRKGWRQISPAFNADRISAPFLMQVPEQEYRSNVELLS
jgi:hypothetical protein